MLCNESTPRIDGARGENAGPTYNRLPTIRCLFVSFTERFAVQYNAIAHDNRGSLRYASASESEKREKKRKRDLEAKTRRAGWMSLGMGWHPDLGFVTGRSLDAESATWQMTFH